MYGPNPDDPEFFKDLFNHTNNFSDNEIIMDGDFNVILNGDMDKLNGPQYKNKQARREIIDQMEMLGLSDVFRELHPSTKKFTRYQSTPVVATRLDYFFVT